MENPVNYIDRLKLELMGLGFPLLLILVLSAFFFSVWYYKNTVPPVSGWKKWALVSLRAAALFLLLAALAEPVLKVIATVTKESVTAVLFDTSSSMDQKYDPRRKRDALDVLRRVRSHLGSNGIYFAFNSRFRDLVEGEIDFSGSGTDLLNALTLAGNLEDVSSVLLISDGRWNLGADPSGSNLPAEMPVNTVTVGSGDSITDIAVNTISAAPIGREGEYLPVEVVISSAGEMAEPVPVEVIGNDRILASGTVSLRRGTTARTVFDIPLSGHGDHTFSVLIKPSEDEYTENNTRSFSVHVVKSSFRILVAADKPSADLAFIRRVIEAEDAFELEVIVEKGVAGELKAPFPDDLSGFDALILLNWYGSGLTPQNAETVKKHVLAGVGLWILGSSPPGPGADVLNAVLPVRLSDALNLPNAGLYMELTDAGRIHFITSEEGVSESVWNILPPLSSILQISRITSDSRVLANAVMPERNRAFPAIVTGKFGSGKMIVMPVSGIWRWRLMMEGAGKGGSFFTNFVKGAFNWLTSDTETSPLTVTTDKNVYLGGQEIRFEARLYDNVYSPISGAEITVTIDNNPSSKIMLRETKPAVYTGTLQGPEAGMHSYKAVAFLDGRRFAESTDTFTVEDFSLEMLDPKPNPELMGIIASRTGGISVSPAGIDSILTRIKPETITERYENTYHFHMNPLIPLLIILILTVEWSIRKYRGMI